MRITLLVALLSLVGCTPPGPGTAPGDDDGGPAGADCSATIETADVDAFFASVACTYRYAAEDKVAEGDATFTHGERYDIVVDASKTITVPSNDGDLVFDYAAGGTFEDVEHETNVFISAAANNLVLQWDKADETLTFIVTGGAGVSWSFNDSAPPPLPGPLDFSEDHDDLSFAIGTFTGPVEWITSIDGTDGALPLCTTEVSATIDADANAVATLAGESYELPYLSGETILEQSQVGDDTSFRLRWSDADTALEVTFVRPAGSSDPATLSAVSVTIVEGTFESGDPPETFPRTVTYATVANDTATCP